MISTWFNNGAVTQSIAINDRGLQYGDGLFETIAVRDGELRLWDSHVERLQTGCRRLGIEVPVAARMRQRAIDAILATHNEASDALLKIIITRGEGPRGYTATAGLPATMLIGIFTRTTCPDRNYKLGVRVRFCRARLSVQRQTAGMKLLSRLDQVRARSEWDDPSMAEGIMLDHNDAVVCGTMSNLFIVRNGSLSTPELTQCGVSGVMRRHILTIADDQGIACEVKTIPMESIMTADEIFLCNSQFGIWPVARCGEKKITDWPVTKKLMILLRKSGVIEGPE